MRTSGLPTGRRRVIALSSAVVVALGLTMSTGAAASGQDRTPRSKLAKRQIATAERFRAGQAASQEPDEREEGDATEIAERAEQWAHERTAPAESVSSAALRSARRHATTLPVVGGTWSELTHQRYQASPAGYTDPEWSNAGSGFGLVTGRMTALAIDGGTAYAGAADGGVWRSTDQGANWRPLADRLASMSIGAMVIGPDHKLYVGTGEANTSSDSYAGQGVFVSSDRGLSFYRVGGHELDNALVFRLRRDLSGHLYAATSRGLWRRSESAGRTTAWTRVLKPDPNADHSPYGTSFITDVTARPGTAGKVVLAVNGWRNGRTANGFYGSTSHGTAGTWHKLALTGDIDTADVGRTTLQYSTDGKRVYAIVQSVAKLLSGGDTNLQGVFVSKTGDPKGPWTKIADSDKLRTSGSALNFAGFHPGVQTWYNQALAVEPGHHDHVYVSLEEVFETTDGGTTFRTASPYWNYGLSCGSSCPPTTHPDQHALATSGGRVWIGNDGGVFHRALTRKGYGGWTNTNATLHTLQYYGIGTGALPTGHTAYWGGLQDNGTSALFGRNARQMIEPAGGDGGNMIVDPVDGTNFVGEYVDLLMYLSVDGGHSYRDISPVCEWNSFAGCDPGARFIAPFGADVNNPDHWVAGGRYVWDDKASWQTVCDTSSCDWKKVHDLGLGSDGGNNLTTALATRGNVTYAGWVGGGGNPGPAFASGIDTNYGGSWHRITAPNLPQRFVAGLSVDPGNAAHVYAVYNGYSRRWIPGGGVGHVFESHNGGATWTNVSGNLPDIGGDDLVIRKGHVYLATDIGTFTAETAHPKAWSRLGRHLPNVVVSDLTTTPAGSHLVAGTHGRGLWELALP